MDSDGRIMERLTWIEVAPATRASFQLQVDPADGVAARVAVEVVAGRKPRPRLAVVDGVHGDEYDGILACQAILRELRREDLDGTLVVVPVANSFAFGAARRRTPQDDGDLNRLFPGDAQGSLSERLAHRLCVGVLGDADLVFTLHGGSGETRLFESVEVLDEPGTVGEASFAAAQASDFPNLVALLQCLPGRLLTTALGALGVPVIEGEVGGRGEADPARVNYYKERLYGVARHVGVMATADSSMAGPPPRLWRIVGEPVVAGARGIFLREASLNQGIRAGDCLGRVVDAHGDAVAVVRAPADGIVGGHRAHAGLDVDTPVITLLSPPHANGRQVG
jgi:predicted deacylase